MCRSVSPTYLLSLSGPLMLRPAALLGRRRGCAQGCKRPEAATAPWRPGSYRSREGREQSPFGGEGVLLVELRGAGRGQLSGGVDLLDLTRFIDITRRRFQGTLLEDELLHLELGHDLVDEVGPQVESKKKGKSPLEVLREQGVRDAADPLLVPWVTTTTRSSARGAPLRP